MLKIQKDFDPIVNGLRQLSIVQYMKNIWHDEFGDSLTGKQLLKFAI